MLFSFEDSMTDSDDMAPKSSLYSSISSYMPSNTSYNGTISLQSNV